MKVPHVSGWWTRKLWELLMLVSRSSNIWEGEEPLSRERGVARWWKQGRAKTTWLLVLDFELYTGNCLDGPFRLWPGDHNVHY